MSNNNMSLAELISNHKPYRDKHKFVSAAHDAITAQQHYQQMCVQQKSTELSMSNCHHHNDAETTQQLVPSSPSLSQRSCATSTTTTTTSSSGVCCVDGSISDGGEDDEEEEDESSDELRVRQLLPGMTVIAVADYNSGDPTHLALRRNDMLLLLQNNHSPPTIANQRLLLGRRCVDGAEGFFPTCCVEKVKLRVEGRRDQKYCATTLPARGRSTARSFLKSHQDSLYSGGSSSSYHERTVTLHRGSKGFGFVMRGPTSTSPLIKMAQNISPISYQYLDEIEPSGVAEVAGLKRGDFLLAVNGSDVRQKSHESVVQLIRQSGDKVTMTVATPIPQQKKQPVSILKKDGDKSKQKCGKIDEIINSPENDQLLSQSLPSGQSLVSSMQKFSTLPRNSPNSSSSGGSTSRSTSRGRTPPAPPKRDPTTTLTIGRARAPSLLLPNTSGQNGNQSSNNRIDTNLNDDYDSEGRSTKSSSPTTSIQSIIVANQRNSNNNSNSNKIASIRSRFSRRISSFELEEFFSRQSDDQKSRMRTYDSMTAMKKKKGKKLHKNFNSTPDIQKQLMEQLSRNKACNWSNSQEELYHNQGIYSETLPLRGGKFIPTAESSTNFDGKCSTPTRAPPPSYPPPPPPSGVQTSVVKVSLSKHVPSDYANFETVSQNHQMLSSFRAPQTQTSDSEVLECVSAPKAPAPPPPPTSTSTLTKTGNLRPVRHPSTSSTTASFYTRQETIEMLDTQLQQPHIPEPDYSTSEDEDTSVNRDLSTFRTSDAITSTSTTTTMTVSSTLPKTVAQSFAENATKKSVSSNKLIKDDNRKHHLVFAEELKRQSEKIMSKSLNAQSSESSARETRELSDTHSQQTHSNDKNEATEEELSKVRKNIREFERRSSICGESGVVLPPQMTVVQTIKKESQINHNNCNNSNQMRMSKSCFEVDCCDNSSSGVSSDVDGDYAANTAIASSAQLVIQQQLQNQTQTLNGRNSAIVSEKIANLIAATHTHAAPQSSAQQMPRPSSASLTSTIVQKPVAVLPQQQFLHQTRRTSSMSEDNKARAVIKQQMNASSVTCSVPTSDSDGNAMTVSATNTGIAANVPNIVKTSTLPASAMKTVKFSVTQVKTESKTLPTQTQPKTSTSDCSALATTKSTQPTAISLQIDSLGLAAVNEVDVLAELVPPPPEFAAPPPVHASQSSSIKEKTSSSAAAAVPHTAPQPPPPPQVVGTVPPVSNAGHQQLSQAHLQQQLQQQLRQQQLIHQQMQRRVRQQSPSFSTQPPPIPSQPPPATLPHQHQLQQQKEQIKILSPTPHQSAYQSSGGQQYHRHHQAMEARTAPLPSLAAAANANTGQSMPPPIQFSDLLLQQKYKQQKQQQLQQHQQHIHQQQISAAMRLGVTAANKQSVTQCPTHQHMTSSEHQQYATMSHARHTPPPAMSAAQQQHFATLTRQQQQHHLQQQQQRHNYSDYTKLTVQNRLMKHSSATSSSPLPPTQQQLHCQTLPAFARKSVIDWTTDDVQEWLLCIGMGEHKSKFEYFNGVKLMRIDNNTLMGCGVRQRQHRVYILEKLKHQIWQNHQSYQ